MIINLESGGATAINFLAKRVHAANEKWWYDLSSPLCQDCFERGEVFCSNPGMPPFTHYARKNRNFGELLMLITSELAEAMEGHRKDLMDDKLPNRKMIEVELADALIRILDTAEGMGLDIGGAFEEKMAYNAQREDHRIEARLAEGGKAY